MKYEDDDLDFEEIKMTGDKKKPDMRVLMLLLLIAVLVLIIILIVIGINRRGQNQQVGQAAQVGTEQQTEKESGATETEKETEVVQQAEQENTQATVIQEQKSEETTENSQVQTSGKTSGDTQMTFQDVTEKVTAKEQTNLRDNPDQDKSTVVATLANGEQADRTGINEQTGWSRLSYNGTICYAVSSYLTTDLNNQTKTSKEAGSGDGLKTKFTDANDTVTAKIEVNLRALPSVTNPDASIVAVLHNGETVTRTGINDDYGWSRVDYNGQTLYCVSSYLTIPQ